GISLLLVPGYALGGRLGAMFEMNLFGALLALGMYVLAHNLGATLYGAVSSWALFAFASPVVVYSSQIYPEIVGGLCSVFAVIAFAKVIQTRRHLFLTLAGSSLALLPWLSIRYWIVLSSLGAGILL